MDPEQLDRTLCDNHFVAKVDICALGSSAAFTVIAMLKTPRPNTELLLCTISNLVTLFVLSYIVIIRNCINVIVIVTANG